MYLLLYFFFTLGINFKKYVFFYVFLTMCPFSPQSSVYPSSIPLRFCCLVRSAFCQFAMAFIDIISFSFLDCNLINLI